MGIWMKVKPIIIDIKRTVISDSGKTQAAKTSKQENSESQMSSNNWKKCEAGQIQARDIIHIATG